MSKSSKKARKKHNAGKPRLKVVGDDMPAPESIEPTTTETHTAPQIRKKAERQDGSMSGLDAAAKVLFDEGQPLNAKEIIDRVLSKGLWKTDGKTPHATLYSAILREIKKKGDASRFKKSARGKFEFAR
jgi:hypothetical protein